MASAVESLTDNSTQKKVEGAKLAYKMLQPKHNFCEAKVQIVFGLWDKLLKEVSVYKHNLLILFVGLSNIGVNTGR